MYQPGQTGPGDQHSGQHGYYPPAPPSGSHLHPVPGMASMIPPAPKSGQLPPLPAYGVGPGMPPGPPPPGPQPPGPIPFVTSMPPPHSATYIPPQQPYAQPYNAGAYAQPHQQGHAMPFISQQVWWALRSPWKTTVARWAVCVASAGSLLAVSALRITVKQLTIMALSIAELGACMLHSVHQAREVFATMCHDVTVVCETMD
jgi:hypothetical protein